MCQSHTGRLTGLWFLPKPAFGLHTNEWMNEWIYKTLNYHIYLNIRLELFLYSPPKTLGKEGGGGVSLIIANKVEHILYTYFPENWRLWTGLSYIQVILYPGKYSSHTDNTIFVATVTETWVDPPCCPMYTANSTCYELRQDDTIINISTSPNCSYNFFSLLAQKNATSTIYLAYRPNMTCHTFYSCP